MGKLVEIKTRETASSVTDFINTITDEQKRNDSQQILKMMEKASNEQPKMWGDTMIGFGNVVAKSPATGREVEWFKIGFSPRKANLTLYLMNTAKHTDALSKLGKHKISVGCLYINKLADVDVKILEQIIKSAVK